MRFFLHDLEELYYRGPDGDNGNIVKAFRDSKNISVDIIYRDRSIAHTFQHPLLKSSLESINKSQIIDRHNVSCYLPLNRLSRPLG